MDKEELERELEEILDWDMGMYDLWKAVHLGIRYGFGKATETYEVYYENYPAQKRLKYKSPEEVLAELDKVQDE